MRPQAVVAVACNKELEEGVHGIGELTDLVIEPLIIIIPLTKDGCVDTAVDLEKAVQIISSGCSGKFKNGLD